MTGTMPIDKDALIKNIEEYNFRLREEIKMLQAQLRDMQAENKELRRVNKNGLMYSVNYQKELKIRLKQLSTLKSQVKEARGIIEPYCCDRRMNKTCKGYKCSERYDDSGNYSCPYNEQAEQFLLTTSNGEGVEK